MYLLQLVYFPFYKNDIEGYLQKEMVYMYCYFGRCNPIYLMGYFYGIFLVGGGAYRKGVPGGDQIHFLDELCLFCHVFGVLDGDRYWCQGAGSGGLQGKLGSR